ncbi:MAG: methionine synthase [Armatimonadetes bacterium]|nr:methionine synthase [Armatimonadota bacterium]
MCGYKDPPLNRSSRTQALLEALDKRILVMDGATGTFIQEKGLTAEDFGSPEWEGCNEILALTRPGIIQGIHEEYLKAGSDIIEANTFGANPLVLSEYGLSDKTREINVTAVRIARESTERFSTSQRPLFVAGVMGPTTRAISVTGGVSFEALRGHFYAHARALWEGGADYLFLETCQDTRNIKAALSAIDLLFEETGDPIPIAVSVTIEPNGTMLSGQTIEALLASLAHRDLLYLGLNCATGPEFMTDSIRSLAGLSPFRVSCVPNAGLPDENGRYPETPEMLANVLSRFVSEGWVNLIGGCCGTRPDHIRELVRKVEGKKPHIPSPPVTSFLSGTDYLEIVEETRPVIVGERTNVIGSRKFKTLICEEKFEEASEIARSQVKKGAQILDVCLANPDRDELADMQRFLEIGARKIRVPIMIDSTDEKVIESALTYCQGKGIINSVNLEDGGGRFRKILPLARTYGASVVVGTIDDDPDQGMGITRGRKIEIADRSYQLLTEEYGIPPEDIYWDPLVFPCGTGDAHYIGAASETMAAIRLLKERFPGTKTILGISNVSFGLPPAGREVLNSVFLYHCIQAGLDMAIINPEKRLPYAEISEEERDLAEDLLYNRGPDPVAAFAAHFRNRRPSARTEADRRPLSERIPRYVIEGTREGLTGDLDECLKDTKPLQIVNDLLMKGMDEVGRLFSSNKLIIAEVLQSAEVMRAAVAHLEPFMKKEEAFSRGSVLLATVRGDVHDIGKNLVHIILANNGFRVIDLGIKVSSEQLIQAVREHKPDIIGLSGLLVKSAQQMVAAAEDLTRAGITAPMLVGGAALTFSFTDKHIAKAYGGSVAYAGDAMQGLELAKVFLEQKPPEKPCQSSLTSPHGSLLSHGEGAQGVKNDAAERSKLVKVLDQVPPPPDLDRHVEQANIQEVWKYLNPLMLYNRHLGIKGETVRSLYRSGRDPGLEKKLEKADPRALEIWNTVQDVKREYCDTELFHASSIYRFFKAQSSGNHLLLFPDGTDEHVSLEFPRQSKADGLCLADYVRPESLRRPDFLAMFIVTVGKGMRERVESLKARGDYLRSHIIQALALASAEAYAEFLHAKLRELWGFPDPPEVSVTERFQGKYRGRRYSFGYPACPRLEHQFLLFDLLKPSQIGVQLTDGFMMDPEASVSAVVFHHPQAGYFSVADR